MFKEEWELRKIELERKKKEKKGKAQEATAIGIVSLPAIIIIGNWLLIHWEVLIWVAVFALALVLLGINPFSRLFWIRRYIRKQHREIRRLTKGISDEDLPDHIYGEKVLIKEKYNQKIAKLGDKKFLF